MITRREFLGAAVAAAFCGIPGARALSKLLMLGMPLSAVIATGTSNAARVFEAFRDRGTLRVGAPADDAILELRDGSFDFVDNYRNTRTGKQRLFPAGTVPGGKVIKRVATQLHRRARFTHSASVFHSGSLRLSNCRPPEW